MLSPLAQIAVLVRQKRKALGLSQRQVATQAGCSQSYLAQIETGVRPISLRLAVRLEKLFGMPVGRYQRAKFLRGRPRLTEASRAILQRIRRAGGRRPWQYLPMGKPRYPRPDRISGLTSRVGWLEGRDEYFWRNFNSIHFDSKAEVRLNLQVAKSGAQLVGVNLSRLGCCLPVMDGASGQNRSGQAFPAYLLEDGDLSIAWSPQRCVRTPAGYRWPDNLLVIACGDKKITGVVEVDGAPFHDNPELEASRDRELGVPVLHLDAADVGRPDILQRIFSWARSTLEALDGVL